MPRKRKIEATQKMKKASLAERRAAELAREKEYIVVSTKETLRLDQEADAHRAILQRFCNTVENQAIPESIVLVGFITLPGITPIGLTIAELRKVAKAIRNRQIMG